MHGIVVWIQTVLIPTLGPLGLFVVAFFDSSFLSVPEINDLLVVSAGARDANTMWMYALAATLGSLAGCTALWYIGRRGGEALLVKRFGPERVERTRAAFRKWDLLALAIPAIAPPPMPFKIFVLSAGVFGLPYRRFALTLIVARGLRYAFWGVMGVIYGPRALALLQRVDAWFKANAFAVLGGLAVLLAAGVLAAWAWRRRASKAPPAPML
jgi:membrane protein YqaA with SNARE-associated domain